MLAVTAAVLVASACGTAELEVSDPPPTHPDGVVVVTSPLRNPTTDSTLVEEPAVSTTEPSTTTESTVPTTTAATTTAPTTTAPPSPPPPQPPTAPAPSSAAEASVSFVNQKRAENGRPGLQVDPALVALAEGWAQTIAGDGNLRHNPQLSQQIPDGYMAWGENVGYAWAADVIDNGWWSSEGHRNNILSANYDSIGVAFVRDSSGTYWGVQVFGGH